MKPLETIREFDAVAVHAVADATRPAELNAMEKGWDRYQATLAHETAAKAQLLALAKVAFPELAPAELWPELWVSIPSLDASHETKYVKAVL